MKKFLILILLVCFWNFGFAQELYWYSASASTKPAQEIVDKFNSSHNFKVVLITGGSGQLLSKIKLSKLGDIYSPASTKYALQAKEELGYEYDKLLVQKLVFGISKSAENKVKLFEDLFKNGIKLAIGNPDTMAIGKTFYTSVLTKFTKKEKENFFKNRVLDTLNISQTVNYIKTNTVDAGLLFDSTAKANSIKFIEFPEKYSKFADYYIGTVKTCKDYEKAVIFIEFVKKQKDVFKKYGFTMAKVE